MVINMINDNKYQTETLNMHLPVNQVISGVFIERVIKMEGLIL